MERYGPRVDLRPLFPKLRRGFLDLLTSLSDEEWQAPTVCPGWTVHDVVTHVLHDHLRRLSDGRDRYQAAAPFEGSHDDIATLVNRANEEFVRANRRTSPRVLVDLVDHVGPAVDAYWSTIDLDEPAALDVSWADAEGPSPAWLDIAREYTEYWTHEQQVRDAVTRDTATAADLTRPALDALARALHLSLRDVVRPEDSVAVLRVDGEGVWAVRSDGRSWVHTDASDDAVATVTMSADTFWRLATRGITPDEARGRATLDGDADVTRAVTEILSIVW